MLEKSVALTPPGIPGKENSGAEGIWDCAALPDSVAGSARRPASVGSDATESEVEGIDAAPGSATNAAGLLAAPRASGAPGTAAVRCVSATAVSLSGSAVKNSFAMRARTAGSGSPAGMNCASPGRLVQKSLAVCRSLVGECGAFFPDSLVLMVVADFDVFERGDGVVYQHGGGAVQRN